MKWGNPSFLAMLTEGGVLPLVVFVLLFCMSLWSWAVIIKKGVYFVSVGKKTKDFVQGLDLKKGVKDLKNRAELSGEVPLARLFLNAEWEFSASLTKQVKREPLIERIERRIEKSISDQSLEMEGGLSVLATISGSAPFIGLFGTVVGIVDSFYSIGAKGAASIAVVAPGISTALVATAFGLFTAIPALVGFNLFRSKSRRISAEMYSFGLVALNLFDRELVCSKEEPKPTKS